MPRQLRKWANIERTTVQALSNALGVPAFTITPANLDSYATGALQVTRSGGGGSDLEREIDLEVDSIHAKRASAWDLAAAVQTFFEARNPGALGDIYVDESTERFGPAIDSETNENFTRITATYTVVIRTQ